MRHIGPSGRLAPDLCCLCLWLFCYCFCACPGLASVSEVCVPHVNVFAFWQLCPAFWPFFFFWTVIRTFCRIWQRHFIDCPMASASCPFLLCVLTFIAKLFFEVSTPSSVRQVVCFVFSQAKAALNRGHIQLNCWPDTNRAIRAYFVRIFVFLKPFDILTNFRPVLRPV